MLALGFAAKLYPALLLPLAVALVWRRRGRREALVCLGVFAAVALAIFLPFFVLSPRGVWHSVFEQGSRPLQIESLGAAVLLALHHLFGLGATMVSSHGSQNLGGSLPNALAAIQSLLQAAAIIGTWVLVRARRAGARALRPRVRARRRRVHRAREGAFAAVHDLAHPARPARVGTARSGLRALRRGLPAHADVVPVPVLGLRAPLRQVASWTVLVRDLVLVALLAVLAWPTDTSRALSLLDVTEARDFAVTRSEDHPPGARPLALPA